MKSKCINLSKIFGKSFLKTALVLVDFNMIADRRVNKKDKSLKEKLKENQKKQLKRTTLLTSNLISQTCFRLFPVNLHGHFM